MSHALWKRPRTRALATLAGAGLVAATLSAAPSVRAAGSAPTSTESTTTATVTPRIPKGGFTSGKYMVTLKEMPAAVYSGGKTGYPRTRPTVGKHFNSGSDAVVKYRGYLQAKHNRLLSTVGATAYHDYTAALNGFAAYLTGAQAQKLAKQPGVLAVQKDYKRQITTSYSSTFMGMTGTGGMWDLAGGRALAGKNVIVGVLDTGIWPESASFQGNKVKHNNAGFAFPNQGIPSRWHGRCQSGEAWNYNDCTDKIIGARYFFQGFGKSNIAAYDYLSPRDGDSHGSHTSSTAAGNIVHNVAVGTTQFGTLSGMAPAAQIATYKVCWDGRPGRADDGCANSDSAAAVDQAVADGVDVINYSIGSGSESTVLDETELAFLGAAGANVYVAVSAGNSGPGASTLDHPSPWVSTTAASTFRISEKKLVLGNGHEYIGASTTSTLPSTSMVLAADSAAAGATTADARRCFPGTLDPADVTGKLVVCVRGSNARIEKSFEVKRAGGAGMVLVNDPNGAHGLAGDLHAVPSIHVEYTAYDDLFTYVRGTNPTGAIVALEAGDSDTAVPEVADFSSRGPSTTTGGDILKPDLAAPGVDVLAAVAPVFDYGRSYDMLSGTSMASPHNAGLAAVIRGKHQAWSPMEIKSALMTTTRDHVSTNDFNGGVFAQGAGFVRPTLGLNPGVVFNHGYSAWLGYLETVVGRDIWTNIPSVDGTQLNQASIAIGALTGVETVTRTLTNVGASATYTPSANVPGIDVSFSPATLSIPAGESRSVRIHFTRTTAAADAYTTGAVTWTGGGHTARMPVAIRPVEVSAPAEVGGTGLTGSTSIAVTAGFTGTLGHAVAGLIPATSSNESVTTGAFDSEAPPTTGNAAVDRFPFTVSAGTKVVRFNVDGAATDDLDLWVYKIVDGEATLVDVSADGDAEETVTLVKPGAGTYVAYVHGYAAGNGAYVWNTWLVGSADAGNLTVTPATHAVTVGQTVTFNAAWSVADSQKYLGWIGWTKNGTEVGGTVFAVN